MKRDREVPRHEELGEAHCASRFPLKAMEDGTGEAAPNRMAPQVADTRIVTRSRSHQMRSVYLPHQVVAHAPEGVVGSVPASMGAKPSKQNAEFFIDKLIGHQSWLTPQTPTNGPQREQRLVRRALSRFSQRFSIWNR